ncbi:MAG: histidine--tRNA ligase [Aeropyrum sp.]|nr:histidine--tRNA ligase [Aeropyrum sp.]MCE4615905.1 histidine--tRNA ligase [Aeropyrum sp.]
MAPPRPPRGFRDFPPEVMILRRRLVSRLEEVFERYGFDPIDTPALEYWETLAGKYGEEAESRLIWRFQDPWSGRWYALRYDLTVPLARFVASNPGLQMPFKRYHIGKVWRHEEPQKGRYREFLQCDADIVGSPHPEADGEVVSLTIDALESLGFSGFRVRVNDRRLLAGVFEEELGLSNPTPVYRAVDKLDKIGEEGVYKELSRLGLGEATVGRVMELIGLRGRPGEVLPEIARRYGGNRRVAEAVSHLEEALSLVEDERVVVDMSLVRGLDYYTGPILEAVLDEPRIGSVAGGGRYDGLIGLFSGREIPATGVSIGLERIIDAGLELGVYSLDRKTVTRAAVVVLDREAYSYAWRVASELRRGGVNTRIDLSRASGQVQRRKALKMGIEILVFVGPREASRGTATVYNVRSGERVEAGLEDVVKVVLEAIG